MKQSILLGNENELLDREKIYNLRKIYYDKIYKERYDILELRLELNIPKKIREKLENAVILQKWITVKSDGEYATLPHQYVVHKNWNDKIISFDLFNEMIRYYGSVEIWKGNLKNWSGRKGEYLRIGNFKYWTMGYPLEITTVLNRENFLYKTHEEYKNHPHEKI